MFFKIFPLAFVTIFFFEFLPIFADPVSTDPEKPIPIVPLDGENGNLGKWQQFAQQAYQINDQCWGTAEHSMQEMRSNRIYVQCHSEDPADCNGASLLICYPSVLDPEAWPDEDDEGYTPILQATTIDAIPVDPKSSITKGCNELMEACKGKSECPMPNNAKKWGEKWHGFRVTRLANAFRIEMPFGKDGRNIKVDVPDMSSDNNKNPKFFITFGKMKSMLTQIVQGESSDTGLGNEAALVLDKVEQQKIELYGKNKNYGMRLKYARGLWMLARDILPVEEKQIWEPGQNRISEEKREVDQPMIRWFTRGNPAKIITKIWVEKDKMLQMEEDISQHHILAEFLSPRAADPKWSSGGLKQISKDKTIPKEPGEPVDKMPYTEEFGQILDGTSVRLRGMAVNGNFKITLVIGYKKPDPNVGEQIFEIAVDFEKDMPKDQCNIKTLANKNNIPCDNQINPFGRAKTAQRAFWIQIEFQKGGKIRLNLDCTVVDISVDNIPNSMQSYLLFQGKIILFKAAENDGGKVLKTINEGMTSGPKPALISFDMKGAILSGNNLIYMSGMAKRESQFSIKFVQLESEDALSKLVGVILVNIDKDGLISTKWSETATTTPVREEAKPIFDILFYMLISRDSNGNFVLLINGVEHFIQKGGNFNFIQINGWIEPIDIPIMMQNMAADYKKLVKFDGVLPDDNILVNSYVNLYFTPVKPLEPDGNKINVKFDCTCPEKLYRCDDDYENTNPITVDSASIFPLALTMDLKEKSISAKTFKRESRRDWCEVEQKLDATYLKNYTFDRPLWLTIRDNYDVPGYKVMINNENVFSIKSAKVKEPSKNKFKEISKININGFFALLNKIILFPYGFAMKNVKEEKLPENLHITVKGIVMANAKMLQFFLATPNYISKTDAEGKARNIMEMVNGKSGQRIGTVHLHVRINQTKNELCIGDHNPATGPCNGIHEQSPFVDGKPFLLEIIGKDGNAAYSVRINGKQIGEEYQNLDAMTFVITGDMVLFDTPKCEPECPGQQKKV